MSYDLILTDNFKKEAKKLLKKYASLKLELAELGELLQENPTLGISLGNGVFKIRLAVASKNKGKSGGMRILYLVRIINQKIYLFSIFDKSEKESISAKDITEILKNENLL
ncbi:hypothetical protein Q73A0000_06780 [Kaistella flava (ex Peng et al. 2021)]|uniref:Addiction module toxin RelE n=1 Tax=Kaistella flava (ex Peng et al. 2021) TaxID=2038776 RepID=A0A7M2Y8V6_9FLAO|nr:type II toxin-antitoxin system RelE/ParE family toxin [Kaistella flava (ex Peng et al. 2021)]QOW10085.1 hypothetical protein Q73A0000_06780 [Kaistella flava (ex Peng et al. 2021)]